MFVNLFLLFICVNFALNLVGAAGSPLAVDMDGDCHPYLPGVVEVDPVIGQMDTAGVEDVWHTENNAPGQDGIIDIYDVQGQIKHPDDNTETAQGVWSGATGWFNSITDAASKGWAAMETMMNMVSGGYIVDIIENTSIDCQIDNRALLTTVEECSALPTPVAAPCDNPYFGHMTKPRVVETTGATCLDSFNKTPPEANKATAPCLRDADNIMWDQFKTGVYAIFSVLLVITLFYWLTGRGHILSS